MAGQTQTLEPCEGGVWEAAFDHRPDLDATNCVPIRIAPCTPTPDVPTISGFFEIDDANPCNRRGFEAIHMSLIPVGVNQGKLLVFGHVLYPSLASGQTRLLRWAIVDPVGKTMQNYEICMPPDAGDLFCAGHAWLPDGRLLVAGGTEAHRSFVAPRPIPPPGNGWTGARLVYTFDPSSPPASAWQRVLPDLDARRWYPSVVVLGKRPSDLRTRAVVVGGSDLGAAVNSYQAQNSFTGQWDVPASPLYGPRTFAGPDQGPYPFPSWYVAHDYPRQFLLSNGLAALVGMFPGVTRMDHYQLTVTGPIHWQLNDPAWLGTVRNYGTAVLFPLSFPTQQFDRVVAIGGDDGTAIRDTAQVIPNAISTSGGQYWQPFANLNSPRWFLNSVLLPDSTILVTGGEKVSRTFGCSTTPALNPEIYRGGAWRTMNATTIIRDYHSSALLLPSGKVMTASGESRRYLPGACPRPVGTPQRTDEVDYQVFAPPYLHCGHPRPVVVNGPPHQAAWLWPLGSQQEVSYQSLPAGTSITSVVLARAGSVTHHCDPNQRVASLSFVHVVPVEGGPPVVPPRVNVTVPSNSNLLPQGYYMLFLVTNLGTPSEATWVQVQ